MARPARHAGRLGLVASASRTAFLELAHPGLLAAEVRAAGWRSTGARSRPRSGSPRRAPPPPARSASSSRPSSSARIACQTAAFHRNSGWRSRSAPALNASIWASTAGAVAPLEQVDDQPRMALQGRARCRRCLAGGAQQLGRVGQAALEVPGAPVGAAPGGRGQRDRLGVAELGGDRGRLGAQPPPSGRGGRRSTARRTGARAARTRVTVRSPAVISERLLAAARSAPRRPPRAAGRSAARRRSPRGPARRRRRARRPSAAASRKVGPGRAAARRCAPGPRRAPAAGRQRRRSASGSERSSTSSARA